MLAFVSHPSPGPAGALARQLAVAAGFAGADASDGRGSARLDRVRAVTDPLAQTVAFDGGPIESRAPATSAPMTSAPFTTAPVTPVSDSERRVIAGRYEVL